MMLKINCHCSIFVHFFNTYFHFIIGCSQKLHLLNIITDKELIIWYTWFCCYITSASCYSFKYCIQYIICKIIGTTAVLKFQPLFHDEGLLRSFLLLLDIASCTQATCVQNIKLTKNFCLLYYMLQIQ